MVYYARRVMASTPTRPRTPVTPPPSPKPRPAARARTDLPASRTPPISQRAVPVRRGLVPRLLRPGLVLLTLILIADGFVGDKGLSERRREARRHDLISSELARVREINHQLRDRARRLREEDPAAIEDLARRHLGMIKPGEVLFVIKDVDTAAARSSEPGRTAPPARLP
jgi:cell division protein FtsB